MLRDAHTMKQALAVRKLLLASLARGFSAPQFQMNLAEKPVLGSDSSTWIRIF